MFLECEKFNNSFKSVNECLEKLEFCLLNKLNDLKTENIQLNEYLKHSKDNHEIMKDNLLSLDRKLNDEQLNYECLIEKSN